MLLGMFIMFVAMSGGAGIIIWLVWRRMAEHLKGNEEGVQALTRHLFVPLIGQKEEPKPEPPPEAEAETEPRKIKGARLV
jgi:hypothetical protein